MRISHGKRAIDVRVTEVLLYPGANYSLLWEWINISEIQIRNFCHNGLHLKRFFFPFREVIPWYASIYLMGNEYIYEGGNSVKTLFWKGVYYKRKDFAPFGSKFEPPFQKRIDILKVKQIVEKLVSLVKYSGKPIKCPDNCNLCS